MKTSSSAYICKRFTMDIIVNISLFPLAFSLGLLVLLQVLEIRRQRKQQTLLLEESCCFWLTYLNDRVVL